MESGPYHFQLQRNDSSVRKQEQSLLYLCVWRWEADNGTVVPAVTMKEMTSAHCTKCDKRHNSLYQIVIETKGDRRVTEGVKVVSVDPRRPVVHRVFRLAVSASAQAFGTERV